MNYTQLRKYGRENGITVSRELLIELLRLCEDLDTLNPRNTMPDGSVGVGPGRLISWQDVTKRILPELRELVK